MTNPVVHFETGARDSVALREFYQRMFGWKFETGDPNYSLVASTGEGGIGGGIMQLREGMPDYVTVYVGVRDLDAALAQAAELRGGTVVAPTPIPGIGKFAMLRDPEGHVIGLLHTESREGADAAAVADRG